MTQLFGLSLIFMATFILGGVLFIKLEEVRLLYGTKEVLLVLTLLVLLGIILTSV